MNLGTHFDYNNHIAFISTHAKIGTSHEKVPVPCKRKWICWFGFFEGSSFFSLCLGTRPSEGLVPRLLFASVSPIVSNLSTRDKNQNFRQGLLVEHIQKPLTDSLVPGALRWWAGVVWFPDPSCMGGALPYRKGLGTKLGRAGVGNDRSIADCISGCRKAVKIGQKLAEKEPLGLKYAQLIRSHTIKLRATRKLHAFISTPWK